MNKIINNGVFEDEIELDFGDGQLEKYLVIATYNMEDKYYLAVISQKDDEIVILEYGVNENNDVIIKNIEDDSEYEKAENMLNEILNCDELAFE